MPVAQQRIKLLLCSYIAVSHVAHMVDNHTVVQILLPYQLNGPVMQLLLPITGIIFKGVFYVQSNKGERKASCLFTSDNTRTLHLEIVTHLSVEAFLLAL